MFYYGVECTILTANFARTKNETGQVHFYLWCQIFYILYWVCSHFSKNENLILNTSLTQKILRTVGEMHEQSMKRQLLWQNFLCWSHKWQHKFISITLSACTIVHMSKFYVNPVFFFKSSFEVFLLMRKMLTHLC